MRAVVSVIQHKRLYGPGGTGFRGQNHQREFPTFTSPAVAMPADHENQQSQGAN